MKPASATPLMEATIEHPAVDAAAFDEIESRLRDAGMPAIDAVGHRVAHDREGLGERLAHSDRLRPLPRKHERDHDGSLILSGPVTPAWRASGSFRCRG